MASDLYALSFAAADPVRLARFWAGVLGWPDGPESADGVDLLPADDTGFRLRFLPSSEEKVVANRIHFDLRSGSDAEQAATVERALGLGARHIDVGQRPEEGHVVLADPEGNEFCVVEAGNNFLADCGFIGALSGDGTQQVGYFWRDALAWPLVWDRDEETAVRSPHGGPKVTWGGPPLPPKPGRNRLHLELVAAAGSDPDEELKRLAALGARVVAVGTGAAELTDPDGNEFVLWRTAPGPSCG